MKKALALLQKAENAIIIVAFIVMVLASFAQVVNRNLIGAGISWFEELARYCMVYLTLMAAEIGLRDGSQISITAITDMLRGNLKKIIQIIAKIVVVIFAGVVFYTSFDLIKMQLTSGQMSPGMRLPMYIPYFALTLSAGIIFFVQISTTVLMMIGLFRGSSGESKGGSVQ